MELQVALIIGTLFGTGVYLLMRPNTFSLLLGLSLLSHGINLFILASGRITLHSTPVLQAGARQYADPLPQALILTAIVISFAVTAFAAVLVYRIYSIAQTENPDFSLLLEGASSDALTIGGASGDAPSGAETPRKQGGER